jgi:hypothetical protein
LIFIHFNHSDLSNHSRHEYQISDVKPNYKEISRSCNCFHLTQYLHKKECCTARRPTPCTYGPNSRLGGETVSMLATGPKIRGFKPGRGDGFLRAIKIRSTPSFRGDVKPSATCGEIITACKNHFEV